ncbi:hypothetical protein [Nostoc sp.]|uniref:hypothetical protein n=1 Tax=Nostoc sp. TaxID=1180 RepID=UPI002FF8C59B
MREEVREQGSKGAREQGSRGRRGSREQGSRGRRGSREQGEQGKRLFTNAQCPMPNAQLPNDSSL